MTSARATRMLLASCLLLCAAAGAAAAQSRIPMPELPRGQGKQCVEPTEIMRRDHMTFLLHQRDATVHEGIRTPRHSLTGCVSCHATRDASGAVLPVNAPGQFCAACHDYAAVRIDCFECHATRPDASKPAHGAGAPDEGALATRLRERVRLQSPRE